MTKKSTPKTPPAPKAPKGLPTNRPDKGANVGNNSMPKFENPPPPPPKKSN